LFVARSSDPSTSSQRGPPCEQFCREQSMYPIERKTIGSSRWDPCTPSTIRLSQNDADVGSDDDDCGWDYVDNDTLHGNSKHYDPIQSQLLHLIPRRQPLRLLLIASRRAHARSIAGDDPHTRTVGVRERRDGRARRVGEEEGLDRSANHRRWDVGERGDGSVARGEASLGAKGGGAGETSSEVTGSV
jgi:hypothetical protein